MNLPSNDYNNILAHLKERIRGARQRAALKVNAELLSVYWDVGNTILEQQKDKGWGAKVIDQLSIDLRMEFTDMKGFSVRNLKYMRAFAEAYPDFTIVQQGAAQLQNTIPNEFVQGELAQLGNNPQHTIVQGVLAQLSWYHHITLLDKVKEKEIRLFYIQETVQNGWSRDVMVHQIEGRLHERKGKISSNFANTIAPEQSELVQQLFKDPYKFEFIYLGKEAKERDLEDALTNQLKNFLLELGQYFSFMGRQYKLVLGEKEYFFDLLFYHTRLKRYIVIDLKIDEFKPEYKGKMEFYLNLADEHLKQENDEKSIGLILCKTKDGLVVEYALRDSTKPIGIAEYKINELLPENIRGELPSIEELEAEIEKEYEELKTPGQKRFEALKEKLGSLKGNEIKQIATTLILFEIFDKSLMPLFQSLLNRMDNFKEMFVSTKYYWQGKNHQHEIENIEDLPEAWKDEAFLKSKYNFSFLYQLNGFIKAGTETFDSDFEINYRVDTYWYGISLTIDHNYTPIIKKLYHEQFTKEDIEKITDLAFNKVMDDIEKQIDKINKKL